MNDQSFKKTVFDAEAELSYEKLSDLNGKAHIEIGIASAASDHGKPSSSAKAYLAPAKNRTNLHVIKYACVTKLNVDNTTDQDWSSISIK